MQRELESRETGDHAMRERDSKEASGVLRARSWVEDEEGPAVEAEADGLRAGGDQECVVLQ